MGKIWKNLDKPLLLVTVVLFLLGSVMVFSASSIDNPWYSPMVL